MAKIFLEKIFPDGVVPKDIKLLTWATTIRWIGWGVVESLVPVFLFSFAGSYAETGLLGSVYDLTFLFAVPLAGLLIDKISARTVLIIGLCIYPFIGFSYFWAGFTGMALFVVIGRFLNGIGYAFDSVGRSTYFRRHADGAIMGKVFGYFDSVTTFFWVLAVLSSLILIKSFPLHQLFLAIIPTSFIALGMLFYLKKDYRAEHLTQNIRAVFSDGIFYSLWNEVKGWNSHLRLIGFLTFFLGFMGVVSSFIIPLDVWINGANLSQVILIGAASALPSVFSIYLGTLADKYRKGSVIFGILFLGILFFLLGLTNNFPVQLVIAFCISLCINQIAYAFENIITSLTNKEHYGKMSSLLSDSGTLGSLFGPIVLGVLIDWQGTSATLTIMAAITLAVFVLLLAQQKKFKKL